MHRIVAGFILTLFLFCAGPAYCAGTYSSLVAAAEHGQRVNYTALRLSYAQSTDYDPYSFSTRNLHGLLVEAFQSGDCNTVLQKSEDLLSHDFTQIDVHAMRRDCFGKMAQYFKAGRERDIEQGLRHSLLRSGNGHSTRSAFRVVTLAEENCVLEHLSIEPHSQMLSYLGATPFDRIDGVQKPSGKERTIYFNVSALLTGSVRNLDTTGSVSQQQNPTLGADPIENQQ